MLADRFAKAGFRCVMPDLFDGKEAPASLLADVKVLMDPPPAEGHGPSVLRKIWAVMRMIW